MQKLFFVILYFFPILVIGQSVQNKNIDSLNRLLYNTTSIKSKALVYYQLSEAYAQIDSVKAFDYVKRGLALSKKENDAYGIAKSKFTLGGLCLDYNNRLQAERYYRQADSILTQLIKVDSSKQNLRLWIRSNFNLGVSLSNRADANEFEYLNKIIPVAEKIEANDILAKVNSNIAISFYNMSNYQKAYSYFLKSEKSYKKLNDTASFIHDRLIFASCLNALDSLNKMRVELDKVQQLISKQSPYIKQLYHIINGEYFYETGNNNKAIEAYNKAYNIYENGIITGNLNQLYLNYIDVFTAKNDYKNAKKYLNLSLKNSRINNLKYVEIEVLKRLSKIEFKHKNYKDAYTNLYNYISLSDSVEVDKYEKEVSALEIKYKSEKKEREILDLKTKNHTTQLSLEQKKSQNYLLLLTTGSFLFLSVLGYFGYRNFKRKAKTKAAELDKLKLEQDAIVYNAMLEGQENERQRLAIDLHDGLAGRLSATRIKLEKLSKTETANNQSQLYQAIDNIDDSLTELRTIARNLMPETVLKYGLKAAVEDFCTSISTSDNDIKFILQFYDTTVNIPQSMVLTIYRIIQELINNAVKHSKATEVLVQFMIEKGTIDITVEDNGIGFKHNEIQSKSGLGLNNLKTRVAYLNGTIDFISSPEEGTTVHIEIQM